MKQLSPNPILIYFNPLQNMNKRISLLISLFLYVGVCSAASIRPIFICDSTIGNPYGVCAPINRRESDYYDRERNVDTIVRCGITNVRVCLEYSNFVPNKTTGRLNPRYIDSMFVTTENRSLRPLAIVCGSGRARPLNDTAWFANYFSYLAQRYSRNVQYWEILNEVDLEKKTKNIPQKYAQLLHIARTVASSADSTNRIVFSGLCNVNEEFLAEVAGYNVADDFDIMNIHSYASPENLPALYDKLADIMQKNGWHKPVWLTECGFSTLQDKKHRKSWIHTEPEQASRLPRVFLLSMACGVEQIYWYNSRARERDPYSNEEHFGLWHADLSLKPAARAYTALTQFCPNGSSRPVIERKGRTYLAHWITPEGKNIWAVWSTKQQKVSLRISETPIIYNLFGEQLSDINLRSWTIGPDIQYIEGVSEIKL